MSLFGGKNKDAQRPSFEMFAIFDSKVGTYGQPKLVVNEATLHRDLLAMYSRPPEQPSLMWTNPEDFQVFKVGEYFAETGTIVPQAPTHVVSLHEVKAAADAARVRSSGPAGH